MTYPDAGRAVLHARAAEKGETASGASHGMTIACGLLP
jgi:hypothetical protein